MTEGAEAPVGAVDPRPRAQGWPAIRRLIGGTVGACFRYRVTGLAAEAAFFAILSLPPLLFGLVGSIGYVANQFEVETVANLQQQLLDLASRVLTQESVSEVLEPTLVDVTERGRFEVISLGFVLALWSGSRALNVFIDTITIMYGLGGRRGIVKTRAMSFGLYVLTLVVGVVLLPLVLLGPELVADIVPDEVGFLTALYWPVVVVVTALSLASLYHLSVPVRSPWRWALPGAAFALLVWIGGSYLLRWTLSVATDSTSIYGPLAAPIAVLLWLYVISIAILIGAALNASWDRVWPSSTTAWARREQERAAGS